MTKNNIICFDFSFFELVDQSCVIIRRIQKPRATTLFQRVKVTQDQVYKRVLSRSKVRVFSLSSVMIIPPF